MSPLLFCCRAKRAAKLQCRSCLHLDFTPGVRPRSGSRLVRPGGGSKHKRIRAMAPHMFNHLKSLSGRWVRFQAPGTTLKCPRAFQLLRRRPQIAKAKAL